MRHKFADLIHAWADGADIEVYGENIGWTKIRNPIWHDETLYRIKPGSLNEHSGRSQPPPMPPMKQKKIIQLLAFDNDMYGLGDNGVTYIMSVNGWVERASL